MAKSEERLKVRKYVAVPGLFVQAARLTEPTSDTAFSCVGTVMNGVRFALWMSSKRMSFGLSTRIQ